MEAVVENPESRVAAQGGADVDSLRPGQKLGRYTLLTPIAQGGMARVWAARQTGTRGFQKMVAIKTIMPSLAADAEFERMFLDEARIAAAVHHPNVCEILDLGEEGTVLFLAMEWVDGASLLTLLKARPHTPLPDLIAVRILADACAGLHAAHEMKAENGELQHVVHRDVSPHNILIAHDGTVKVADFGVAKAMGLDHAPTMAGQLKGKVAYMSPEQAIGDLKVDRRSDIFSLGAVLYETVTGRRAWPGANDVARLQNLLGGNIIPPRQIRPDLPGDLENILARALAMDPAQRFQSAEQMRLALEQFLIARHAILSPSDVGRVVMELCGKEIEERRVRIRKASSAVVEEVAPGGSTVSRSIAGVTLQGPPARGMKRSTATAITVLCGGVTLAGLLGIVAIGSLPTRNERNAAAATASAQPLPSATPKSDTIVLLPKPADAVVEMNGVVIGTGRQAIQRPQPGTPVTILVKAANFDSATLTLDQDSAPERVVELAAAAPAKDAAPPPKETAAAPKETAAPPKETAAPPKETAAPPKETAAPPKETRPPKETKTTGPAKPPPTKTDKSKTAPAIPVNPY